jgi:hypothetical protein
MTSIEEEYKELLNLTKTHILQNFSLEEWMLTDQNTFSFFKSYSPPRPQPLFPLVSSKPQRLHTTQEKELSIKENFAIPINKKETKETKETKDNEGKKEFSKEKFSFTLEPMQLATEIDLKEIHKLVKDHFPSMIIIENPLQDEEAKRVNRTQQKTTTTPAVIILSFNETAISKKFLENIAKAIQLRIAPALVLPAHKIEQENAWERMLQSKELRLVISPDYGIYTLPKFMRHYKESPKQGKRFLGNIPLFLLSDISLYLKEPTLKPQLWKALKEMLS